MPLRVKSQSFPEHWSKDFVEHLRTVHFSLVTVSVGLILLLSSRSYDPKKAASEMDQIVRIADKPILAEAKVDKYGENSTEVPYSSWFEGDSKWNRFLFHFEGTNVFYCSDKFSAPHLLKLSTSPHSINEFAQLWNFFTAPVSLKSIVKIGRIGHSYTSQHQEDTIAVKPWSPPSNEVDANVVDVSYNCDPSNGTGAVLKSWQGDYLFLFNARMVEVDTRRELLYSKVAEAAFRPFEYHFHDLAEATRGREDLDFGILAPQIYAEAGKGDEQLEAFGIKIPSNEITSWGIIALIGVQLYLLMYLKRLSNKLKPDDPGWDVPWMAMDESRMARTMLFVSLVLLPFAAALFIFSVPLKGLVGSTSISLASVYNSLRLLPWSLRVRDAFIGLSCCLSVWLGLQCWKNRPTVCNPVAPKQLFE